MAADNAYPPTVCGVCWHTVAYGQLDQKCPTPAACPHVVREIE